MPTDNWFEMLKAEMAGQLERAAIAYLKLGLEVFHKTAGSSWESYQPATGNLAIAVELLLKTAIAKRAFRYLFTNLPLDVQVYLSYPETIRLKSEFRRYAIDVRRFKFAAPELDVCTSLFYTLFPHDKGTFRPYLSLLSDVRNRSVHAALPTFEKYDLYRVAYLSILTYQFLEEKGVVFKRSYTPTEADQKFVADYNAERIERVKKVVEAAKERSRNLGHEDDTVSMTGVWDVYTTKCPICDSGGVLGGYTDLHGTSEEDLSLDFYADSFSCTLCGLNFDDAEQLRIAGMDTLYDRNEELDGWMVPDDD